MKVYKIRKLKKEATDAAKMFFLKNGSERIAGVNSLQFLLEMLRTDKPDKIAEFGAGIGTMDWFCLTYSNCVIDLYEDNEFCIGELKKNLTGFELRYKIYSSQENFNSTFNNYDLVIVDGHWDKNFKIFIKNTELKKIYFEGKRRKAQLAFLKLLRNKYIIKYYRIDEYNSEKSGYCMVLEKNNSSLQRWLNYLKNRAAFFRENVRLYGFKTALYREKRYLGQINN